VLLAVEIYRQTSVGQQWIADRLGMKSAANVSQQVRRSHANAERRTPRRLLRRWRKLSSFVD
jgi:transcriptional regulator